VRVFPYVLQIWWLCFQTALLDVFRNDDATPNLTSHLSFLSKEIRCTRKQQSEGEFDNPLTFNVEIENAWTHTATPPIPIWCSVYTWENVALNVSSWTQRIHGRSPPLKHKRHRSLSWAKRIQSTFTKSTTLIQRKLKWSRYRSCVAQGVGRCVALLFHDRGTRRGWVVSSTARPHFTPGKDPVPILQEAGWAPGPVWTGGKSRPHWSLIPDRPACTQSLYRLSYPAHTTLIYMLIIPYLLCLGLPSGPFRCGFRISPPSTRARKLHS